MEQLVGKMSKQFGVIQVFISLNDGIRDFSFNEGSYFWTDQMESNIRFTGM